MKKTISLFLSIIIIIGVPFSVFASATNGCSCGNSPVVYVRGFGSELYLNPESENPEQVFAPPASDIMKAVPDIIKAVNSLVITKNNDAFMDSIIAVVYDLFGKLDCDDKGNSVNNIGAICPLPTVDTHKNRTLAFDAEINGEKGEFAFVYDWRADPVAVAQDLNEYINAVCSLTGHDKVILCAHSEGNCIAASYIEEFGTEKIEKAVLMSGAYQGLGMVGHLFTKDVSIKDKGAELLSFIDTFLGGEPGGDMLTAVISMLKDAGVIDKLLPLIDGVLDEELDRLYDDLLIELFGTMPGIWAFVPDEYYEQAKTAMLGNDPKYSELIEKIDNYHYNVQCRLKSLLTDAKNDGVAIAVSCGYGVSPIPVYDDCYEQGDMLVDTKYMSIGATCATIGATLDYTPASHASSDGIIDASTCLFPDYTWFVKYQDHNDFCAAYREFIMWLVEFDGQPSVNSSNDYPQFMTCRDNHSRLVSLDQGEERAVYANDFIKFFVSLIKLIMLSFAR